MSESKKKSKHRHTPLSDSKSRDALISQDVIENGLSHSKCNVPNRSVSGSESSPTDIRGAMRPFENGDLYEDTQERESAGANLPSGNMSPAKSDARRCLKMYQTNQDVHTLTLDNKNVSTGIMQRLLTVLSVPSQLLWVWFNHRFKTNNMLLIIQLRKFPDCTHRFDNCQDS